MNVQDIHGLLQRSFPQWLLAHDFETLDPWIEVKAEGLPEVARYLRDQGELAFNMLHCITAVDYFEPDQKKAAQVDWQPHLELIYHLSSTTRRHRLVLKVRLPRWISDEPGQLPEVPSLSDVWRTADWHEREVFDLMGVRFIGHPELRRILCPEDWVGHPLRKDYQMPASTTEFQPNRPMLTERIQSEPERFENVEFDVRTDEMLINMGPQQSQHARRVAAGVADRRRGGHRGNAADRLSAPLGRKDRRESHSAAVSALHRPARLPSRHQHEPRLGNCAWKSCWG